MATKIATRRHPDRHFFFSALILSLLATSATAATPAADSATGKTATAMQAERCITIRSIRQTKVVDDQTIIFYTTGSRNYKNRLPHSCSGLAIADSFSYKTSQTQLCSVDIITVLNRMGSDFSPGPSCGLGEFEPITREQLDELTNKSDRKKPDDK